MTPRDDVRQENRAYTFRAPVALAEQLDEYQRIERRRSSNDALIVLVSEALERWRLSKLPRAERAADYPQ
jgi:hypothetical protein